MHSFKKLCQRLRVIFLRNTHTLGVPKKPQTHQGPQFAARQFQKLLDRNVAVFAMAMQTPNQERLGPNKQTFWMLCEVDVKFHCKDPKSSHFELRVFQCDAWNLQLPNGTLLPVHYQSFDPKWTMLANEINTKRTEMKKQYFDLTAYDLKSLKIGDKVRTQDSESKQCDGRT